MMLMQIWKSTRNIRMSCLLMLRLSLINARMMSLEPLKITVPFAGKLPTDKEAVGLMGQFLGHITKDQNLLPIGYNGWPNVCETQKGHDTAAVLNRVYIEPESAMDEAKKYIISDIGKKWRNFCTKI
ncbi:hypothetical protein LINGRAHAP2_LOCUS13889, partial [Linum grandiflorum]